MKQKSLKTDLTATRARIARLDQAFLKVFRAYLSERAALARHVGSIKRGLGLSVRDAAVEEKVRTRFKKMLGSKLPASAVRYLSGAILRQSRKEQKT
jgi:chorismate mutase